jgi:WD40 repeat protein
LLVDQCEELFSLCEDPEEQQEFLRALTAEAGHRTVVVALRADRLADLAGHPGFSRLVERGMYLVGGLDEDGLRTAVETPARQAGLVIEPGLVDLLVREVGSDPGALPLLSHALQETWKRREGNTLTVAGYRASGGINGAVAQSAEGLYSRVAVEQRRLLRDLVLRLVSPGLQGEPVRTRVPRRLVGTDPEHEQLIEMLVAARLVTSDDGALEITHEALTRAWPRLQGWLDDDLEGQRIRHHLSAAADAWDALGRPDSELYRGVRLARALEWSADRGIALTEGERAFLEASSQHAEAEQQSIVERARAQARLIRRLRIVLTGAVALLVLALIAGWIAAVQSNRAGRNEAEARNATDNARRAAVSKDARRVGAGAQLAQDISLSLLLGAAGARLEDSPETRVNLLAALAKRPTLVRSAPPAGGYLEVLAVSPDGRWIASSDDQNRMHLYDARTSLRLDTYDAGRPPVESATILPAFSPDSRRLAIILQEESAEPVRLLDPNTMQITRRLALPGIDSGFGVGGQFSADGRYLAATVYPGEVTVALDVPGYAVVWDLLSPSKPPVRIPIAGRQGLALSPDGRTLYTGQPLAAYDLPSGRRIWRRPEVNAFTLSVNPQGTRLSGPNNRSTDAFIVDAATGETLHVLHGLQGGATIVRFSANGKILGTASGAGEITIWDTATGRPLERWDTFDPWGVGFSPDGDLVYSGGGPGSMLRTWDRSAEDTYLQETAQVRGLGKIAHADFAPDGRRVAYSWLDDQRRGWVTFVDTATGAATPPSRAPVSGAGWASGVWHPQGQRYVAFCSLNECADAAVLDPATGRVLEERTLFDGATWSIGYVNGNHSLLVGGVDDPGQTFGPANYTILVDAETLKPEGETFDLAGHWVIPIGDGSTAMVHEQAGDLASSHWRVIDVRTGDVLSEGDLVLQLNAFAASPDGSTVAMAGAAGEIVTIEVTSGEDRRASGLGVPVRWLKYSDDGELLVSAAEDGGVSLWDAATLELLGTVYPPHHGEPVPAGAQFVGDSHDVAIASHDGRIYRWETDLDRALDFACQMAGRDLTEEEWEQYLPAQPYRSVCPDL